ncbi:hypothetical protein Hamer_G022614, partial [Homarus americanus]
MFASIWLCHPSKELLVTGVSNALTTSSCGIKPVLVAFENSGRSEHQLEIVLVIPQIVPGDICFVISGRNIP